MIIRQLTELDLPRLTQIYEKMGIPLPFPNLKEFLPMSGVVDENDQVVAAVGSVPTVEVWFFIDKDWETPGMKLEAFRLLHNHTRDQLLASGIVQAHAFLPPKMEGHFGKRLKRFGWIRSYWPCFSRRTDYG